MKKKLLWLSAILCICALIAGAVICVVNWNSPEQPGEESAPASGIKIERRNGSYAINVDDPAETVGYGDHVFIAYVERMIGTEYKNPVIFKGRDLSMPYTNYSVRVLENIKGTLYTDREIEVQKDGGIYKDQQSIALYEDDLLPEAGKIYIFVASVNFDGKLLISSPNSNIPLEEALQGYGAAITEEQIAGSAVVQGYREAYANEVPFERVRFHSIYEEGYVAPGDGSDTSGETDFGSTTASGSSAPSDDSDAA